MLHPIVRQGNVLYMKLSGIMDRSDWVALLRQTRQLERESDVIPHRITDGSAIENLDRGYYDMVDIVADRARECFPNSFKSAIVAPAPIQFGCARMFKTLNSNPQIDIRIFPAMAEAEAWIAGHSVAVPEGKAMSADF